MAARPATGRNVLHYNQMVVDNPERLDEEEQTDLLFHALSDRTRRDIMAKVGERELSISDLARQYDISFAAIQKHVTVLERASLVTKRTVGRQKRLTGNTEALRRASELLARYEQLWVRRIAAIDQLIEQDERK